MHNWNNDNDYPIKMIKLIKYKIIKEEKHAFIMYTYNYVHIYRGKTKYYNIIISYV